MSRTWDGQAIEVRVALHAAVDAKTQGRNPLDIPASNMRELIQDVESLGNKAATYADDVRHFSFPATPPRDSPAPRSDNQLSERRIPNELRQQPAKQDCAEPSYRLYAAFGIPAMKFERLRDFEVTAGWAANHCARFLGAMQAFSTHTPAM